MARLPVTLEDGRRMVVTASMGIAQVNPAEPPEAAIARADAAVYRAKHEGRNRVCAAEPCGPPTPQRAPARAKTSGEPGLWTGA